MKVLRRMLAWFVISLGVLALGLWATARFVVHTVDDGSFVSGIASTVLHQSDIQELIVEQAQTAVASSLSESGVDLEASGMSQQLNDTIASTVGSEAFIGELVDLVKQIEKSVISQLTDDSLPLAPLELSLNITEPLFDVLNTVPGLSTMVPPQSQLDPITVPAFTADEVQSIRHGYDWVERVGLWGMWVGIALLLVGFLIMPRKRWIIPKMLFGGGLVALAAWYATSRVEMDWVYDHVPGGAEGGLGTALSDLLPQSAVDRLQSGLLKLAIILLVLAVIAFMTVRMIFRDRDHGEIDETEDEPPADSREFAPLGGPATEGVDGTTPEMGPGPVTDVGMVSGAPEGDAVEFRSTDPNAADVPYDQESNGGLGAPEQPPSGEQPQTGTTPPQP